MDYSHAKKICKLSKEDIEIAKKKNISPRGLISHYKSTKQEKWKKPTKEWLRTLK